MGVQTPANTAAYLQSKKAPKLTVRSAPYTPAKASQIVIKNHAIAINPLDWLVQERGDIMFGWLKYPFIMGIDVAGEVVEVGSAVTRFKIGDRVIGFCTGTNENINDAAQSGFQEYTVVLDHMSAKIPDSMSYEKASVIPLGLSTASCGLFQTDQLSLQLPTSPARKQTGKTILIWGGSTSVGVNAIQLAVAAGYEVFTTCSPRNYELVKSLGASQAWDYNSPTVVNDMVKAFKDGKKKNVGAMSIGQGAASFCLDILGRIEGDKFLAMASYPTPATLPKRFAFLYQIWTFLSGIVKLYVKAVMKGVKLGFIFGGTLVDNGIGKEIYGNYVEKALEMGDFKAAPEPEVFGRGLDKLQGAMEAQRKGVSAKKIIVVL
ncbi:related to oxidoreductase [Phialocephala subalpina]|uniref:Related to oxidoreductase n=1 Tax=Phialocephala subalpina TaxID=576137 RepID=A0A1L7XKU1_9HELO|nr:related to oxidoreductase [Phialocephala subalpina]